MLISGSCIKIFFLGVMLAITCISGVAKQTRNTSPRTDGFHGAENQTSTSIHLQQGPSSRQSSEAALTVTVVDTNNAVLPASRLILSGLPNFQQTLFADQRGVAVFVKLSPGKYRLQVETDKFEPYEREIVFKSGNYRITVSLEPARVKDEVAISQSEREKHTDPRSDTFTTVLTEEQIANLPDDPDQLKAALEAIAGPGAIILVDGFAGGRIPPKSQIRQIRFRRDSFAAEYHAMGAVVVEILTKPGASYWHGSVGVGYRNQALNARNAFAPFRAPEGLQRLELTLDVPVRPNRTSLFLAADGKQLYESKTIFASLPTGDFNNVIRLPSRTLYVSSRVNHLLNKSHDLRVNFIRVVSRSDNLGVGDFSLPERAFMSTVSDYRVQVAESGAVGSKIFHELRLQLHWQNLSLRPVNDMPGLVVIGAFHGGGAQARSEKKLAELNVAENVDFAWMQHAMRAGILFEAGSYHNLNLSNQNGVFTFSGLTEFRAGRPATFYQRVGGRPVEFSQRQFGAYWQDDWRITPSLTLSYGVRYEWQNNLRDRNNSAPRFGFGWSPFKNGRTTIRGGLGVYYEWLTAATYDDLLSEDGQRGTNLTVINPGYPDPTSGGLQVSLPPGRSQLAANARSPYFLQSSLSLQRQLPFGMSLLASYSYQQGFKQFRGLDINAPIPRLGRPDPTSGNIVQLESIARSSSQTVDFTLNSGANNRMSWMINYSFSRRLNETDSTLGLPADNFNLRAERGPAGDDVRHRITFTTGLALLKGWRLTPTFFYNSPRPYNITTGRDNNSDTVFQDRPSGITRNSARGAAFWNVNARLSWLFGFGKANETNRTGTRTVRVQAGDYGAIATELGAMEKKWRINYYLQVTNVFNRFNPTNFVGIMTSPFFGRPIAAAPARQFETGIKISF
jgi:hypothetical protein